MVQQYHVSFWQWYRALNVTVTYNELKHAFSPCLRNIGLISWSETIQWKSLFPFMSFSIKKDTMVLKVWLVILFLQYIFLCLTFLKTNSSIEHHYDTIIWNRRKRHSTGGKYTFCQIYMKSYAFSLNVHTAWTLSGCVQ